MTRLTVGDPAPPFELPDVDGTVVPLAPAEAAATVVVFTANGCPYARAWHDRIQAVARDYADRDVTVLQIVSNDDSHHAEDSLDSMRQRVVAGEFAGPLLHDAEQSAAQAYGATATPEVFVIDRAGVVRYHGAPDGNYDDATLDAGWVREALDDVLAGREVARPYTSPAGCSVKWRVELLWWEGCPTHDEAAELLEQILDDIGKGDVLDAVVPTPRIGAAVRGEDHDRRRMGRRVQGEDGAVGVGEFEERGGIAHGQPGHRRVPSVRAVARCTSATPGAVWR